MRKQLWALLVTAAMAALPVDAQETRGNITGTVQDASGVVPGNEKHLNGDFSDLLTLPNGSCTRSTIR